MRNWGEGEEGEIRGEEELGRRGGRNWGEREGR